MTAPLVSAEIDLRDFAFMPLDVVRLRDSTLAVEATGDEFRAAVLLWCVAWHQVPAASLPDDERALAMYAGYGRDTKAWAAVAAGALRGFVKCEDGRLYHSVLAEKAVDGWSGKLRLRHRRECERIKKAAQRAHVDAVYPSFDEWKRHLAATGEDRWTASPVVSLGTASGRALGQDEDFPRESRHDGALIGHRGEGTGEKKRNTRSADAEPSARFIEFWAAYPRKDAKKPAAKIWANKDFDRIAATITADVKRRIADGSWNEARYVPHAATYLNQERWNDGTSANGNTADVPDFILGAI